MAMTICEVPGTVVSCVYSMWLDEFYTIFYTIVPPLLKYGAIVISVDNSDWG